jgi:3-oxoacyl-[acyl-carrier protein] reductase
LDLELAERVAIITGASAGIGRAIAAVLAAEGTRTVIVARRRALLASLAQEIEAEGGPQPMLVEADLCDAQVPHGIANDVLARHGRIDILVNSAGGSRPMAVDADDAAWDEAFALNFSAARRLAQAVLPAMRRARWGRIINITGSVEPRSVNGAGVAKAAVHAWAKGLAVDVAAEGITVNCLGPGRIHSEQIDQRLHPTAENRLEFVRANIPIGYFGEPTDMAYPVAFLCSPKARYITGQRMYVDGGMSHGI